MKKRNHYKPRTPVILRKGGIHKKSTKSCRQRAKVQLKLELTDHD